MIFILYFYFEIIMVGLEKEENRMSSGHSIRRSPEGSPIVVRKT